MHDMCQPNDFLILVRQRSVFTYLLTNLLIGNSSTQRWPRSNHGFL